MRFQGKCLDGWKVAMAFQQRWFYNSMPEETPQWPEGGDDFHFFDTARDGLHIARPFWME